MTAAGGLGRRLAGGSLILLFALLPGLLAGATLDAPAAPGELARATAALADAVPGSLRQTDLARWFHGMWLEGVVAPDPADAGAVGHFLARARLAQVAGVLAIGLCTYLVVMLAQGRGRALLTCAALTLLAPIHAEGHVLRPETPATLFGLLSVLLMLVLCGLQRPRPRRSRGARTAAQLLGASAAGCATALAVASQPTHGTYLLVPGAALALATGQAGLGLLRTARRRRWPAVPIRAITRRLLPWAMLALMALLFAAWLLAETLPGPTAVIQATPSPAGLLPASWLLRGPLLLLGVLGALSWLLRLGLRLGRSDRLWPEILVAVHTAVLLAHWLLRDAGVDALPAAVPAALLVAEGAVVVFMLTLAYALRRRS